MDRRVGADTSSAFALLEHADEDGFIENIEDVLEQYTETKSVKRVKQKQSASVAAKPAVTKAAGSSSNNKHAAAAGPSRAAFKQSDSGVNKLRADDYYRAFQHVYKDASTGEVVLRFHKTNIVRIKPNGDIILNTGGWYTYTTVAAMNDALYALNMGVTYKAPLSAGVWAVTDDAGRVHPYQDNMVIPATQPQHKGRGNKVIHAYAGGAEVPVYATKSDAAGLKARSNAAAASRQGAVSRVGAVALHTPVNHAASAAASASYAVTARTAHMQQQQHTVAVTPQQQTTANAHALPRKTVHEQLQEAVEQLGIEDELLCGDEHLCVVCLEHTRDEVLVPCGHMVLCRYCCGEIMKGSKECPVCREEIVDHCTLEPHEI